MAERRSTMPMESTLRLQSWLSPGFPTGAYAYSRRSTLWVKQNITWANSERLLYGG